MSAMGGASSSTLRCQTMATGFQPSAALRSKYDVVSGFVKTSRACWTLDMADSPHFGDRNEFNAFSIGPRPVVGIRSENCRDLGQDSGPISGARLANAAAKTELADGVIFVA